MYNRKQLCSIAGMPLDSFKHAAKSDDLPMVEQDDLDVDNEAASAYARYSRLDAIAVACAWALREGGGYMKSGLPFPAAAKILSQGQGGTLRDLVTRAEAGERGLYIGYAPADDGGGRNVFGALSEIEYQLVRGRTDASVLYLVSIHVVLNQMAKRAADEGITFEGL